MLGRKTTSSVPGIFSITIVGLYKIKITLSNSAVFAFLVDIFRESGYFVLLCYIIWIRFCNLLFLCVIVFMIEEWNVDLGITLINVVTVCLFSCWRVSLSFVITARDIDINVMWVQWTNRYREDVKSCSYLFSSIHSRIVWFFRYSVISIMPYLLNNAILQQYL